MTQLLPPVLRGPSIADRLDVTPGKRCATPAGDERCGSDSDVCRVPSTAPAPLPAGASPPALADDASTPGTPAAMPARRMCSRAPREAPRARPPARPLRPPAPRSARPRPCREMLGSDAPRRIRDGDGESELRPTTTAAAATPAAAPAAVPSATRVVTAAAAVAAAAAAASASAAAAARAAAASRTSECLRDGSSETGPSVDAAAARASPAAPPASPAAAAIFAARSGEKLLGRCSSPPEPPSERRREMGGALWMRCSCLGELLADSCLPTSSSALGTGCSVESELHEVRVCRWWWWWWWWWWW